jgi:hypothetical protein
VLHLFQCFLMAFQVTISQGGSMHDLVEHSPSIFNAPKFFWIHVNQAIPHNDIRLTTTSNDLLMNMCPAIFKSECFLPVSYVFKSRYLPFAYKQQSRSSCTDLLHQWENFVTEHIALAYIFHPTTTIPPVQRIWKEFLPKFRPW